MPLFDYYCRACDGVFELLRPSARSSEPAPCPDCDADSERLMPIDFSALTVRDGLPRRLPDRGAHWHMGKEVSSPVNRPASSYEHPEIHKKPPPKAPSVEEIERFQHEQSREAERINNAAASGVTLPRDTGRERSNREFRQRAALRRPKTSGSTSSKPPKKPGENN